MKTNTLYWIIGVFLVLIVIVLIYSLYKTKQQSNSLAIPTNSQRVTDTQKNCTQLYNSWQAELKKLEFYSATGLTRDEINNQTVVSRNAEIAYNNCNNS